MEEFSVGALFVEILKTGAMGYLFTTICYAIGRKEFGALIKILTIVLCAILAYQLVDLSIKGITGYFDPIIRFFSNTQERLDFLF